MGTVRDCPDVDQGWAWMAMAGSFVDMFVLGVMLYSQGVVQIILLDVFDGGIVTTTWIVGIAGGLLSLPGPLVGLLSDRTSCRTSLLLGSCLLFVGYTASAFVDQLHILYVTLSVLTGLGMALVYSPALVVLGFYFKKKLNLATAVAATGGGLGMMVGAPLVVHLEEQYGWRGMFLILAGIGANCFVSSLVRRPNTFELAHVTRRSHSSATEITEKCPDETRCRKRLFGRLKAVLGLPMVLFCGSILLCAVTVSLVTVHLPNYLVVHGGSTAQSALLITPMGLCNTISRPLSGVLINAGFVSQYVVYAGSYGVMAFLTLGFTFIPVSLTTAMVYAGLFGLCTGGPYVVLAPIAKDLVGLRHLAVAFGVEMLTCGLGTLAGPPIAGGLFVLTGSYTSSFVFAGITCACGSLFGALLMKYRNPVPPEEIEIPAA